MSIKIYNTMTKKKEEFKPTHPGHVKMYVCGPTVYDFLHIGNFFGAIFFNLVRNWFEKSGYIVEYVYNFTDVDDRIITRAQKEGVTPKDISERYITEFKKDYSALNLRPHSRNPKVTDHMEDIISLVKTLVEKGHAYILESDVYFDVKSFKDYGQLTNKNIEDNEDGFRIEADERKKHPADFALWKGAKEGEVSWPSPWGAGRPGWHIECSAMIKSILGDTIDIHGGGLDLTFPHHENEIAQSVCGTGGKFVNYWMHNNMLNFGDQKMSKSLGNIKTGRAFLDEFNGEILKFMILSSHYRSTIDFSDAQVDRAIRSLGKFYSSLVFAKNLTEGPGELVPVNESFLEALEAADKGIAEALNDDFNTPEVMAKFYEIIRLFNVQCRKSGPVKPEQKAIAEVYYSWLRDKASIMALFQEDPAEFLLTLDDMLLAKSGIQRADVDNLVRDRSQARANKDWAKSDVLRDKLKAMGISVQDGSDGSVWEVEK